MWICLRWNHALLPYLHRKLAKVAVGAQGGRPFLKALTQLTREALRWTWCWTQSPAALWCLNPRESPEVREKLLAPGHLPNNKLRTLSSQMLTAVHPVSPKLELPPSADLQDPESKPVPYPSILMKPRKALSLLPLPLEGAGQQERWQQLL